MRGRPLGHWPVRNPSVREVRLRAENAWAQRKALCSVTMAMRCPRVEHGLTHPSRRLLTQESVCLTTESPSASSCPALSPPGSLFPLTICMSSLLVSVTARERPNFESHHQFLLVTRTIPECSFDELSVGAMALGLQEA